jgi:hypothetical protein
MKLLIGNIVHYNKQYYIVEQLIDSDFARIKECNLITLKSHEYYFEPTAKLIPVLTKDLTNKGKGKLSKQNNKLNWMLNKIIIDKPNTFNPCKCGNTKIKIFQRKIYNDHIVECLNCKTSYSIKDKTKAIETWNNEGIISNINNKAKFFKNN